MKFRKKPVIVDAEQFRTQSPLPDGVTLNRATMKFVIQTLEGEMEVNDNDWIVTGVKGETYPIKNDIFLLTYSPVKKIRSNT